MIALFTDFGLEGPYLGQVKAVLCREAPGVAAIDLFADVPPYDPAGAAYLLAAYSAELPAGTVLLCVVDPGVGSARRAAVVQADGRWYVGPDNGLFNVVARRATTLAWWDVTWRPERLSASFHGRDLFAPVAARLATGALPGDWLAPKPQPDVLLEGAPLARVIYVDHYGNCITGIPARGIDHTARLTVGGRELRHARVFGEAPPGEPFWYENSAGLVEIALAGASAAQALAIGVGAPVALAA